MIYKGFAILAIMKLITILAVVFFLTGCAQPLKKKPLNPNDISFADYVKSLDTIPLPFSHACTGSNLLSISTHFDTTGFKKYRDRNCAEPMGILFNDKDNTVLVDISNADYCRDPFLVSFDKKGNKIDVLNLYRDGFEDDTSSLMPYFTISSDKKIIVIDTLKKWKPDSVQNKQQGLLSVKVDSTVYMLSKKGKFILLSGKK